MIRHALVATSPSALALPLSRVPARGTSVPFVRFRHSDRTGLATLYRLDTRLFTGG